MKTSAFVVARRRKSSKLKHAVRDVSRVLDAAGWEVDSRVVKRKYDLGCLATRAVKDGVDVVVAVGGDGRIFQVDAALAERGRARCGSRPSPAAWLRPTAIRSAARPSVPRFGRPPWP